MQLVPGWVKRDPALRKMFSDVLCDYRQKYGVTGMDILVFE